MIKVDLSQEFINFGVNHNQKNRLILPRMTDDLDSDSYIFDIDM